MRLRIGAKIGIVFLIFFAQIATFMFIFSKISRYHEKLAHNLYNRTEEVHLVMSLQLALAQVVMPVNDFLIFGGDPDEPENFKVLNAKVTALIERLDKVEYVEARERKLLNHIKEDYARVKKIADNIFSFPDPIGNLETGRLMETMDAANDEIIMEAEKFHHSTYEEIEKAKAELRRITSSSDALILVMILFNIVLILAGLSFFRRTISSPINSMRDIALKVGRGNLEEKVTIGSRDEIGDLAASFNKMTEDLRETTVSKNYMDNIIGSMLDTLIVVDPDAKISMVNTATCELLGYKEEELIGKDVSLLFPEEEEEEEEEEEVPFRGTKLKKLIKEGGLRNYEVSYRAKDGGKIPVLLSGAVLKNMACPRKGPTEDCPSFKEKGKHCEKILGVVCVAKDITEREKSAETFQHLVVGTSSVTGAPFFDALARELAGWLGARWVMLSRVDPKNPKTAKPLSFWSDGRLGSAEEYELAGTPCGQVCEETFCLFPGDVDKSFPDDTMLISMGVTWYAGAALRNEAGEVIGIICAFDSHVLSAPANIREIFSIFAQRAAAEVIRQRIEEEMDKAREAAEIANRAKSDFLANMSHELRTPLNAVIGFSELLTDKSFGPLNDKQSEYVTDIWQSGRYLLSLINDVLDVAKIEAGKMTLELHDFNLRDVVEDSVSAVKENAFRHTIDIVQDIEDIGVIRADERKVRQVLLNIVSNAVKFTPDGGTIGIEVRKKDGDDVLISIWDTGIGIEDKDKDKVFKEFEQIDSSYTRKYSGTGLGMPLAKKMVELHGGKIWFESGGINKGTRFSFTLPPHSAQQILCRCIEGKIAMARKENRESSVFVISFSGYSEIEKKLGKAGSRETVFKITRNLKKVLRAEDCALEGGEGEIVFVMTGLNKKNASRVNDKLKEAIKKDISEFAEKVDVDFSCGFSTYPVDGSSGEELLKKAKERL